MEYLCFDVGGTNVKYGLIEETGEFLERGKYPTNCLDLSAFLSNMGGIIEKYTENNKIAGVGISLPGYIHPDTGYVETGGAIEALYGVNLIELLKAYTAAPIVLENDANCAALAEQFNGNAAGCKNFYCLTIGTGIGGGLVVNGELVHGHRFRGGEFGYMITIGKEEGYRNLHELASTKALIDTYKLYKDIPVDIPVEGHVVFEEAISDPAVRSILDAWYERLSFGIFNVASVLNPEKILIGGAVSVREDLYTELEEKLKKIPFWEDLAAPIAPCKYRNDAGMLGALYKLLNR